MERTAKTTRIIPAVLPFFLAILCAPLSARTADPKLCRPVASVPLIISTSGIYCLSANLSFGKTRGTAIVINADNVTLDLTDRTLDGSAAGLSTKAAGISATGANVTIRNGIVRGFNVGLALTGSNATVRDLIAIQNKEVGISAAGPRSVIERNQILATGGAPVTNRIPAAVGIVTYGPGSLVRANVVSELQPPSIKPVTTIVYTAFGILVTGSQTTVLANVVGTTTRGQGGATAGIFSMSVDNAVTGNIVENFSHCVVIQDASTLYAQNTTIGCGIPYRGHGTAGSDNH